MESIIKSYDGVYCPACSKAKWQSFIKSLSSNNTYLPEIERIIFNLKTTETVPVLDLAGKSVTDEKGRVKRQTVPCDPVLATIVKFADGTKCSVVNSDKDAVTQEEKEVTYLDCDKSGKEFTVKTGRKVTVASETAKEAGVVYAIVKRLFGLVDQDPKSRKFNHVKGDGFGHKLRVLVETAEDCQYEAALKDEFAKRAVKEHKEREAAAKERRANRAPTLEENIATLVKQNAELLAQLAKK